MQIRSKYLFRGLLGIVILIGLYFLFRPDEPRSEPRYKKKKDPVVQGGPAWPEGEAPERWFKVGNKTREQWLDFEQFSPGNSYNPYPGKAQKNQKQQKEALEGLHKIQSLKYKASRGRKLTEQEQEALGAYNAKRYRDQIDLLKFALLRDTALTDEQRDAMNDKIKELEQKIFSLNSLE